MGAWMSVVLLLGTLAASADSPVSKEYQIKAAFLYNFAKFVDWPPEHLPAPPAPIVIGVFGKNPFGSELENVVRNRKINDRELVVKAVNSAEEARGTDILFFSAAEDERAAQLIEQLRGAGVLTVGEGDEFGVHGGMIRFRLEGDKVRFEINEVSVEQNGLKISAQLLKLATVVHKRK